MIMFNRTLFRFPFHDRTLGNVSEMNAFQFVCRRIRQTHRARPFTPQRLQPTSTRWFAVIIFLFGAMSVSAAEPFEAFLKKHCVRCHGPQKEEGYGQISTTRMSQIMWLDNLAPDIQDAILDLPRTVNGRDPILEKDVRPIAKTHDWKEQRKMWHSLKRRAAVNPD